MSLCYIYLELHIVAGILKLFKRSGVNEQLISTLSKGVQDSRKLICSGHHIIINPSCFIIRCLEPAELILTSIYGGCSTHQLINCSYRTIQSYCIFYVLLFLFFMERGYLVISKY